MTDAFTIQAHLPEDHQYASLIGRIWQPGVGPVLVKVTAHGVYDLSVISGDVESVAGIGEPCCGRLACRCAAAGFAGDLLANADIATRDTSRP